MDYKDWEQRLKAKLETASAEESGYSVNPEKVWNQIAVGNKQSRKMLFLPRPIWSHAVAAISGILISTLIYFLVFHNPLPEHSVVEINHTQQHLPEAQRNRKPTFQPQNIEIKSPTEIKTPQSGDSKNIAATPTHRVIRKKAPAAIAPKHKADTVTEYALINHDSATRQTFVAVEKPAVMHWSDIEEAYKNKSEPQYWAKLIRRIEKRQEKENSSQNEKAPALVWIETFK